MNLDHLKKKAAWHASGPMYLLSAFYLAMAGLALYGQSDGLMAWLHIDRIWALGVGAAIELLAAVLFAFADWRRTYHGERAIAARVLSVAVAFGVAGMNFAAHVGTVGTCALFTGASLAGFAVLVLHTNARRRDALRAAGKLTATPPVYGLAQWLRAPMLTRRARALASADPSLGVHGSLTAARAAIRLEKRQAAIATALRAKLAKSVDPVTAQIAVHTYDLDTIAARLAAEADYDGLTALVAADITPVLLTATADAQATKAKARQASTDDTTTAEGGRDRGPRRTSAGGRKAAKAASSTAGRVAALVAKHPDLTSGQVAARLGIADRTARRYMAAVKADHPRPTQVADSSSEQLRPAFA